MAKTPSESGADIESTRRQENTPAAKQKAAEDRQRKKLFAAQALRAIKAKDERGYSELLRLAGVREGSDEWMRAWQAFRALS